MQMKEAIELRKLWSGRTCDHPDLDKEYDLGSATGDYVCTTCGRSGFGNDWNERERERTTGER